MAMLVITRWYKYHKPYFLELCKPQRFRGHRMPQGSRAVLDIRSTSGGDMRRANDVNLHTSDLAWRKTR
jgi:hypothetical protein